MAKKVSVDFYKKSRTIILLGLLLMVYLFFIHRKKEIKGKMPQEIGSDCGQYQCGGMQPLGSEPLTCPSHCQCVGDPMIPDAPKQCIPKV